MNRHTAVMCTKWLSAIIWPPPFCNNGFYNIHIWGDMISWCSKKSYFLHLHATSSYATFKARIENSTELHIIYLILISTIIMFCALNVFMRLCSFLSIFLFACWFAVLLFVCHFVCVLSDLISLVFMTLDPSLLLLCLQQSGSN